MSEKKLEAGKLPADLLNSVLENMPVFDPRVVQGPGEGLDCAIIECEDRLLVLKSDPITFAADQIGWYAVHVNANDIATSGGVPRWFLATVFLPRGKATEEMALEIGRQIYRTCREMGISVIGGHTEITIGLDRPIIAGTMIGEVEKMDLVTPKGMRAGHEVILTKGVPIEATAILARECPGELKEFLTEEEIEEAAAFLHEPGISVLRDARIALRAGNVSAMHDPTEGGLAGALWEMAAAGRCAIRLDRESVPIPELSRRICAALEIDPMASIASGALLLTASPQERPKILSAYQQEGIPSAVIGRVEECPAEVSRVIDREGKVLKRPHRDEIARFFSP